MIFKPELVRQIQAGRKTMTRRPVRPSEKACRYREGHVYAVQPGRGRRAVCMVTVTDVRLEHVGRISLADAKREGFRTTADFLTYWQHLYGQPDSAGVRDMRRRLAILDADSAAAAALTVSIEESCRRRAERLPLKAIPALVWVISFQRGDTRTDVPRLLRSGPPGELICKAVNPKTGKPCLTGIPAPEKPNDPRYCPRCGKPAPLDLTDDHGYVRRPFPVGGREVERAFGAMAGEPEAISEEDQERLTKQARLTERQLSLAPVRERRDRMEVEVLRLRGEMADRGVSHRELSKRMARIEKELAAIEDLLRTAA